MAQRYDFLSYGVIELWNYGGCGYTGMWGWVVGHGAVAGY